MPRFPHRAVAVLPGEQVVNIDAIPVDGQRPSRSFAEGLVRHRWLILGFTAAVVGAVALWTLAARPVYQASTVIQIDSERPRVVSFPDIMPPEESSNERIVDAYYQTQLELVGSRVVLEHAVESLNLGQHAAFTGGPEGLVGWLRALVLGRPPEHKAPLSTNDLIDALEHQLQIEPIKPTRLIRVTAKLPDRELAARVPNQIAQEYIAMTNAQRREASAAASRWLQDQLVGLRARAQQATGAIQQFVRQNELVPTREGRAEFALQQLEILNRAFTDAENELIQKEARARMLASADADTLAAALGSDLVRSLKADYSKLERELGRGKATYGPEHPKMLELEAEVSSAKRRLETEIEKAKQAMEQDYGASARRTEELGRRLDAQRQDAIVRHAQEMQLQLLRKEAEASASVYAELSKRLKEVQLAAELRVTNVKIADPARTPSRPVSPKPVRDLLLATVGGLIGGIALALLREARDRTLRTPREVSQVIQLPSMGMVPSVRAYPRRDLPALNALPARSLGDRAVSRPAQLAGEAFRSLRTLVRHSRALEGARAILVTSAQPREGKSFTAVNLAVSLAEGGEQVLLIDADFHRSSCHRTFGLDLPLVGLSSVLDFGVPLDMALRTTLVPNLTFLPSGPKPPDPATLFSSERARTLLATLRERFARVIIDCPPVLPVSDTPVLASLVDGVLLVVRAHATPIEAVQITRDRLEVLGVRVLGVVLNDVSPTLNCHFYANYGYEGYAGSNYPDPGAAGKRRSDEA